MFDLVDMMVIGAFLLVASFASAASIAYLTFNECSEPTAADLMNFLLGASAKALYSNS